MPSVKQPINGLQMGFETAGAPMEDWAAAGGMEFAKANLSLAQRFVVPPFSVLDARQGYWQDRKRAWISLGIKSELGRGEGVEDPERGLLDRSKQTNDISHYSKLRRNHGSTPLAVGGGGPSDRMAPRGPARSFGQDLMRGEHAVGSDYKKRYGSTPNPGLSEAHQRALGVYRAQGSVIDRYDDDSAAVMGTSIFDPVLCEAVYRWFVPPSGRVLDPFAGGSVRGVTAAYVGLQYTGIDLSHRQIEANYAQWEKIIAKLAPPSALNHDDLIKQFPEPTWLVGDAAKVAGLEPQRFDFIFTCPPYYNLEVYSDDPADLSTLGSYESFVTAYSGIIRDALGLLRADRFACFVVGDVRGQRGEYYGLPIDTIKAFREAGAHLYNDGILVTSVGSLPVRVGAQFRSGRKMGKTHQNVLVFWKGDPRHVKDALGALPEVAVPPIETTDPYLYRQADGI